MLYAWVGDKKRAPVAKGERTTCRECGGAMKVIACIEDPVVIQKILNHLKEKGEYQDAFRLPESRGPPQTSLFW